MVATASRNQQILHMLQDGPHTSSSLAQVLECPEPSVRRSIQELRRDGYNISFADYTGLYRWASNGPTGF